MKVLVIEIMITLTLTDDKTLILYVMHPSLGFVVELDRLLTRYLKSEPTDDKLVKMCFWLVANVCFEQDMLQFGLEILSKTNLIKAIVHAAAVQEMLSVLVWLASNLVKISGLTTTTDKIALCN